LRFVAIEVLDEVDMEVKQMEVDGKRGRYWIDGGRAREEFQAQEGETATEDKVPVHA
jgi:hypothetical protein